MAISSFLKYKELKNNDGLKNASERWEINSITGILHGFW